MKEQFSAFMEKLYHNNHAEEAPPLCEDEECWYLPFFWVHDPQKPGQIRVVFDSNAQHQGNNVSLNNVLLSGPDLNNNLLSVLLRFSKDLVAIMADIQQTFYSFKEVVEHCMRVHIGTARLLQ